MNSMFLPANGKALLVVPLREVTFCSVLSSAVSWVTALIGSQRTDFSGCFLPRIQPKSSVQHSKPGVTVVVRAAWCFLFCACFTLARNKCIATEQYKTNPCWFISCMWKLSRFLSEHWSIPVLRYGWRSRACRSVFQKDIAFLQVSAFLLFYRETSPLVTNHLFSLQRGAWTLPHTWCRLKPLVLLEPWVAACTLPSQSIIGSQDGCGPTKPVGFAVSN